MHICAVIKDKVLSLQTERNKYVLKRDINYDSDWARLTSFGIEFQTEEEAKENERSPSVALLRAGLLMEAWCMIWSECCECVMAFSSACQ